MRFVRNLVGLVVASGLFGCGLSAQERASIASFSSSSVALASATEDAMVRMREDTIALSAAVIELGDPEGKGVSPTDLDRSLDAEGLTSRVRALRALRDYAELLAALADDDSDQRVALAAQRLAGSFGQAASVGGLDLREAQRTALGSLLARLGAGLIDARRASAIREVVPATAPVVDHLCDIILRDVPEAGGGYGLQVTGAISDARGAAISVRRSLRSEDGAPDARLARVAEVFALADRAEDHAALADGAIVEGVEALRRANESLEASVALGGAISIEGLTALVIEVRELVTLAEVVGGRAPAGVEN